jgi:hypothetical protein
MIFILFYEKNKAFMDYLNMMLGRLALSGAMIDEIRNYLEIGCHSLSWNVPGLSAENY